MIEPHQRRQRFTIKNSFLLKCNYADNRLIEGFLTDDYKI